jgi:hypothetical protein
MDFHLFLFVFCSAFLLQFMLTEPVQRRRRLLLQPALILSSVLTSGRGSRKSSRREEDAYRRNPAFGLCSLEQDAILLGDPREVEATQYPRPPSELQQPALTASSGNLPQPVFRVVSTFPCRGHLDTSLPRHSHSLPPPLAITLNTRIVQGQFHYLADYFYLVEFYTRAYIEPLPSWRTSAARLCANEQKQTVPGSGSSSCSKAVGTTDVEP